MTKRPQVLNMRDYPKGAHTFPEGTKYCGRPGPWGNPFVIGRDGTRDEVCDRFEREVLPHLDIELLRGHHLMCFCAPERCHCDSIMERLYGRAKRKR